ncbi:MAG: hypothetical protein AB7Q29_15355 [Vicinamibacterales bacterium]
MFIGHFALGFAAKRVVPRVSLGMLFLAAQLADVLWPAFVLFGIEQVRIDPGNTAFTPLDFVSYPWSHSLLMLAGWGILLGGVYRGIVGGRRSFLVLSALVVSHWVLDWVSHRPDMPLYPGGARVGLALWNHVPATIAVETSLYIIGVAVYMRATQPRDGTGRWAPLSLAATLLLIYTANVLGGPPPSVTAVVVAGMAGFVLLTSWAWWADRHREPRASR